MFRQFALLCCGVVVVAGKPLLAEEHKHNGKTVAQWMEHLKPNQPMALTAATNMILFKKEAAPAASRLGKLVAEDKVADVRNYAAMALLEIGPEGKDAANDLKAAAMNDADASVRINAAWALVSVSPGESSAACASLTKSLTTNTNASDRKRAAEALMKIGKLAHPAIEALRHSAKTDSDREVRAAATDALDRIER